MRGREGAIDLNFEQRFSFNGKKQSHQTNDQTNYDYGFRIYNAGIGRFLRVDPITKKVLLGSHCCRYFT